MQGRDLVFVANFIRKVKKVSGTFYLHFYSLNFFPSFFCGLISAHCCLLPTAYCLLHFLTSFARASSSYGSVIPICFAAMRLMTNSNLIACCTGNSAGFAPLRILST
jgi:hypothetical protein